MNDEILIQLGEVSEDTKGCPNGLLESPQYLYLQPPGDCCW
jgi:hypothetical protein